MPGRMSRTPNLRAAIAAIAVLATAPLVAQRQVSGGTLLPEEACYDVQAYDLKLKVDPTAHTIDGSLAMAALATASTRTLGMDLDDRLDVHDLRVSDVDCQWRHENGRIRIDLAKELSANDPFTVTIAYGGEPLVAPNPPWKGGFTWAKTKGGKPWIGTSCQGEGADLWWPCKDQPSDKPDHVDITVTVPDDLVCASNGTLVSDQKTADGWRTFHWHEANPISNYCVALNIAPYVVIEDTYTCVDGTKLPVRFYVLPEHEKRARAVLPDFLDHLRMMEETCGPYPFRNEKYGIAEAPFLGMEHQTIIAYGNRFPRGGFDWLHHHEMSHEWWGNLVTCRDWKDMWIHEGIGTYMQALYIERTRGPAAYRREMQEKRRMIQNAGPLAPRESEDSQQIYFENSGNDIYYKGSWVMHTLRWLLGDETFFKALRRLAYPTPELEKVTDGSQCRLTDTKGIREILERVSGRDLKWFFDVYLREPALPELDSEVKDGVLHLRWKAPNGLPFPMPVPVKVGDDVVRVDVGADGGQVQVGDQPFDIDPDGWLLMQ